MIQFMNPELWLEDFLISKGLELETTQYILVAIGSILLFAVCLLGNFVTKRFIVQGIQKFIEKSNNSWDDIFLEKEVFHPLSTLVPLIFIHYLSVPLLSNFSSLIPLVHIAVKVLLVFVVASVLIKALKALEAFVKNALSSGECFRDHVEYG